MLLEVWAVFLVIASILFELRHIARSDWAQILLYNGDSLVLPLLHQSFASREPMHWVFSSQTFFFPEYPLYWLSSLVSPTPQVALTVNAGLNVLLLYVLMRVIVRFLAPGSRFRQILFAVVAVGLFFVILYTERGAYVIPPGLVNPSEIATLFLISTYYYGVILVALLVIALTLWLFAGFREARASRRNVVVYVALVLALVTLITCSNPLYVLQFMLPFGFAIVILLVTRRVSWRTAAIILLPELVGLGLGALGRHLLARFIPANLGGYVQPGQIPHALDVLKNVVHIWISGPFGTVKFALLCVLLIGPLAYLGWLVARLVLARTRGAVLTPRPVSELFVILFVIAGSVSLVAGQIVTGQNLTRYLVTLFVFPLLSLLLFADPGGLGNSLRALSRTLARHGRVWISVVCTVSVLAAAALVAVSAPTVRSMATVPAVPGMTCLERWAGGAVVNGVGSFMVTRPIKLYGDLKGQLLQTTAVMTVQPWMNNLDSYESAHFTFVLVDPYDIRKSAVLSALGRPALISSCANFDIYDYRGTAGEKILNSRLHQSDAVLRTLYS